LLEDLQAGKIPEVARDATSGWSGTTIDRQKLVDYALKIGERPKFLFKDQRTWYWRLAQQLERHALPPEEVRQYYSSFDLYYGATRAGQSITSEQVRMELASLLKNGGAVAIGQPRRDRVLLPYIRPVAKVAGLSLESAK
jgi:hypothetical protein